MTMLDTPPIEPETLPVNRQPAKTVPRESVALFALFAVVYWATRTHYNTFDAVSYANQIAHLYPQTGDEHTLFHPHHLLFNITGYLLWTMARAVGYRGGPLVVLESFNAMVAAGGIAVFYATLRSLIPRSRNLSVLVACGLALSYGYWVCATDGRVNAPSTILLICSFAVLCGMRQKASARQAAKAGILAGLALLYHESSGLFFLVGMATMASIPTIALPEPKPLKSRLRLAAAFAAGWFAVGATGYAVVGSSILGLHSLGAFQSWSEEYAELGWWWDFRISHNLRLDFYALRHAVLVEPLGKRGTFHINPDAPPSLRFLYFATLAGWFAGIAGIVQGLRSVWHTDHKPVLIVSIVWILVYAAFFTIWSPGYFVFWVPTLIPACVLLATAIAHLSSRYARFPLYRLGAVWIVLCVIVNAVASIGPHMRPMCSPFERIAGEYRHNTRPGDLVLLAGDGDLSDLEVNIPYFADRNSLSLHEALTRSHNDMARATAAIQAQVTATLSGGHAVYVTDDLRHMKFYPDVEEGLRQHHKNADLSQLPLLFKPWRASEGWKSSHGPVWKLTPPGP